MSVEHRAISESIQIDSLCTVDEVNGVIRNVRVLGPKSPNCHEIPGVTKGTQYLRTAMESGLPLYNVASVNIDHPDRRNPGMDRLCDDTFGKLENCKVIEGPEGPETRGDLPYYKTHPLAPRVIEDVTRKLGRFALSHNAVTGRAKVLEGMYVVETLEEVRSVDMVTRGATNKNLWESQEPKKMKHTLRQILEARAKKNLLGARGKHLLEDDGMSGMMDKETETDKPMDHEQALDDGISGALKSLVDDYIAGNVDEGEVGKKFCQIVKAHGKIKGGGKDTEEEYEEDEDEKGEAKGDGAKPEKKDKEDKGEVESLKLKNKVLGMVIESKKTATPLQIKALCNKDLTDQERKELLESYGVAQQSGRPQSSVPNNPPPKKQSDPKSVLVESLSPEERAKRWSD